MIFSPPHRGRRQRRAAGFTLLEILVAMLVLALITLSMATIFNNASTIVSQSNQSMGSLDAGEAVLGQIGLDISRMVLRDDIDYDFTKQTGNDRLSFYARTSGFTTAVATTTTSPRPLSVIGYEMGVNPGNNTSPQLNYGGLQIDWSPSPSAGATAFTLSALVSGTQSQYLSGGDLPLPQSYTTLAPEVIRFEYCFVLKTDPNNNTPPQLLVPQLPASIAGVAPIDNIAGILVGLLVVDPTSRALFPANADVNLAGKFGDPTANNQDILSLWTKVLTPATLASVNIPMKAMPGIRVYQRYFPFPW